MQAPGNPLTSDASMPTREPAVFTPGLSAQDEGQRRWRQEQERLRDEAERLAAERAAIEAARAELAAERRLFDRQRAESDQQVDPQPLKPTVLEARLGAEETAATTDSQSASESDGQPESPDEPSPSATFDLPEPADLDPQRAAGSDVASEPAPGHEDESIDVYMARLLVRLNGGRGPQNPETPAPAAAPVESAPSAQSVAPLPAERENVEQQPEQERSEGALRRKPPQWNSDLAAMRQLANLSAQAAIDNSLERRWLATAAGKAIVSATSLASAGFMLYFAMGISDITLRTLPLAGMALAVTATLYWAAQSIGLMKDVRHLRSQLRRRSTPAADSPAGEPTAPE